MNRKFLVTGACAVVATLVVAVTFLTRDSDEQKIAKTLARFAAVVAVKPDDTVISRTARLRSGLKEVVDDDVRVHVTDLHVASAGRKQLEDDAARVGLVYSEAQCSFTSSTIQLGEGATFASVDATADVTGIRAGERRVDRRQVHFLLRKDGDWKISSIDVREATP